MIRPVFTELALFLTPFIIYAAYLWATRTGALNAAAWTLPILAWLTIAALSLMIVSFLVIAEFSGSPPKSAYVPAHIENGRFVPGSEK